MSAANAPLIQRLRLRENHIYLALTIIIGILAGLAAVLFTLAIKGTTYLLFGMAPSNLRYILVPTLMSLVTGFLLARFFPEARGSGVPQTEAAYHLHQGHVPGRVAFGKFVTGVLCIGSGHSMGREGPSVQIGAGIASSIGKWFHLSPARAQSLIPVASAAALSAAFNTPVAAVLFALEEIIGDMNAALLGSTVVASVASVIVERSILGNNPIFHVPQYHLVDPAELSRLRGSWPRWRWSFSSLLQRPALAAGGLPPDAATDPYLPACPWRIGHWCDPYFFPAGTWCWLRLLPTRR